MQRYHSESQKMVLNCLMVTVLLYGGVWCQSNKDLYNGEINKEYYASRQRDPARSERLPSPGDPDYRTYVYNDRRYGIDPNRYNPFNPNINQPGGFPYNPLDTNPLDDQFKYNINRDPNNPDALFPGVLGGWREDLQGKERRDSKQQKRDIFVNTNYGQVQGFMVYLYDNPDPASGYRPWLTPVERIQGKVSVFLGIPYAKPPVLEGRFKPPRAHAGWQLLQAVDWAPACPQPARFTGATRGIRDMDEDCLYLNIFSPSTEAGAAAQRYPVMLYIHGGQFSRGASNLFPAHMLAAFHGVVVVTINYRLGALGFLSTGDENSPGNYGILDQAMALRWVYDNVAAFNGDRDSITLFGPGAGAASAGLLALAPATRHLVTRVIAQSGSALAEWALIEDKFRVQNTSRVFGRLLGCPIDSSWKLVNCLRQGRSFYELGNAEFEPQVGFIPWGPVLESNFTFPGEQWYDGWHSADWRFLDTPPELLVRQRQFNRNLRYMTGLTSQEAAYMLYNNASLAPHYDISEQWFDQKVRELVARYNYTLNPRGVYEAIKYMYTYHPDPHNATAIRDQYVQMLSDFLYGAPTDRLVKLLLEQRVPVYMYVLNTTLEARPVAAWRAVPHDAERPLLLGAPFLEPELLPPPLRLPRQQYTPADRNMSYFFMKAYADFAKYGDPTRSRILGLHMQQARAGQLHYLNINTTYNSSLQLNYRQTELAFWTVYLPAVVGRLLPTYPPVTEYWWEPARPLQVAFWCVSGACLLLLVLLVLLAMLWRNAKREAARFCSEEVFMVEGAAGGLQPEYRDLPQPRPPPSRATESVSGWSRPESAASDRAEYAVYPEPAPRRGVPQTTV